MEKSFVIDSRGRKLDFGIVSSYMDDDIRESVHFDMAPCSEQEFFDEYASRHADTYGDDDLEQWLDIFTAEPEEEKEEEEEEEER